MEAIRKSLSCLIKHFEEKQQNFQSGTINQIMVVLATFMKLGYSYSSNYYWCFEHRKKEKHKDNEPYFNQLIKTKM